MNNYIARTITTLGCVLCLSFSQTLLAQEHDDHEGEGEAATGPNGGRLLEHTDFSLELLIFEQGEAPRYRAWAYAQGTQLESNQWRLSIELSRLGGQIDQVSFAANGDYLRSNEVVGEPHSFDVNASASYAGKTHDFEFDSHEGRVEMSDSLAQTMGIGVHVANPQTLHQTTLLYGKISPDPKLVSHVTARFPGLIQTVIPALGDSVSQGDLLATVEANDSLQTYEIRAAISGIVVDSHANPGEFAGEQHLLTVANYQSVWADLNVFPGEAQTIRPGQEVTLRMGDLSAQSSIRYLNPGEGLSPHVLARVPIDNPDLTWTPGLLIEADVTIDRFDVSLAVDTNAIQEFRDWQVVFIKIGDAYEIRPLELGRSDANFTEVLSGLNVGDAYVVENSYLLKADLEKSGAAHNH